MDQYLSSWGWPFIPVIQSIDYDRFLRNPGYLPGVYIFADLESLNSEQRCQAEEAWNKLKAMGEQVHLLNHPTQTLCRYALLKKLHAENINTFNVYRPDEDLSRARFPVFLRIENDHNGKRTEILNNPGELKAALAQVKKENPGQTGWLITEFCDTRNEEGIFHKYSAFILDGEIIPRHLFFSRGWCQKTADLSKESFLKEELSYVEQNPYKDQLISIFRLANIDYGRMDYGILNGKIQAWEINTNPVILTTEMAKKSKDRKIIHQTFHQKLKKAWAGLLQRPPAKARKNYPKAQLTSVFYLISEKLQPGVSPGERRQLVINFKIKIARFFRFMKLQH